MATGASAPARRGAVKGLATVALLKSNYDEGRDHISMFMPFLLDAVGALTRDDFDVVDVKTLLFDRHHLSVPDSTLRTLLHRATKTGAVRREFDRYFRRPERLRDVDITSKRERAEGEQAQLAQALRTFGDSKSRPIPDDESALALLLAFLAENDIAMLLDGTAPDEGARVELSDRDTRLVARFINDVCLPDENGLGRCLRRALEGLVLQNALLLRDIATAPRKFGDLCVYLDTGFVVRVLGFEGPAAQIAAREGLDLLRQTNARIAVFEKTIDEIKRILTMYEYALATADGRSKLRQTDISRHFLSTGKTSADAKQARALVERQITQLGIEIRPIPTRDRRYTGAEEDLVKRLRKPGCPPTDPIEPRVQHDVDCVAGVLTLRAGRTPDSLDHAKAIFATTSGNVVRTVNEWWKASGEVGMSPIIHYIALSNAAWLKKPNAATDLKLRELVALCAAALRPSTQAWNRFLGHLRKLEDSGELTTDEAVAVVASGLTDKLLSEVEDDGLDATSMTDVVEKVKAHYKGDADARVAKAEAGAASESERRRELELRIYGVADFSARWLARFAFLPVWLGFLMGSVNGVPLALPQGPSLLVKLAKWGSGLFVTVLYIYLMYHDPLKGWQRSLEGWLRRKIRVLLAGREPPPQGS